MGEEGLSHFVFVFSPAGDPDSEGVALSFFSISISFQSADLLLCSCLEEKGLG
jgi:hypothetical protein